MAGKEYYLDAMPTTGLLKCSGSDDEPGSIRIGARSGRLSESRIKGAHPPSFRMGSRHTLKRTGTR